MYIRVDWAQKFAPRRETRFNESLKDGGHLFKEEKVLHYSDKDPRPLIFRCDIFPRHTKIYSINGQYIYMYIFKTLVEISVVHERFCNDNFRTVDVRLTLLSQDQGRL